MRISKSVIALLTAFLLYPCLYAQVSVNFTFNNNVCSGTPVQFTSNVTGGTAPYTYAWAFGDGNTSTAQDPTHTFTSLGCGTATFQNILTVRDANGVTGTVTLPLNILQAPDVQVADSRQFGDFSNCANSPSPSNPNFTLTVNNISPSASCITSYTLKWGDASAPVTVTGPTFSLTHTYTTLGAFDLEITGVGANGCSYTKTYTVANQTNPDIGLGTVGSTEGCAPLDITAVISLWQNNSPGTTYQLNFGDGTPTINYTHPLNNTNADLLVPHTYLTTSCPATDNYRITVTATNACRSKSFNGGNIVVKSKPQAAFNIPSGPLCTNQSVCFTNQTVAGFWNNCSTTTVYAWDFGDPASGSNNTSNQPNPCHQYSAPGTYTVTLTTSNSCGNSTTTRQVCISAPAAPAFDLDATAICKGTTITATNNSNTPGCTPAGYQWTVSYASGFCGTTSSWTFANGTNATSANPSFTFNNPGTYTISLRMTSACGSATATKTVTVKAPPTASLAAIPNACGQATVCPVATVTNCGSSALTYEWLFDGGVAGTSTDANPGCVNFTGAGIHTVSLAVTNECGTTTVTRQFTINPGADINVPSSPPPFCTGETAGPFTFTSTTPGAIITWTNSSPAIGLPASGSGSISAFTINNATGSPIVANIIVSATSNGCSAQSGFSITVNPKPAIPSVTSPVAYCANDVAVPLTATAAAGNTLQWYTTPTGGTASTTAPTPLTTSPGTTNYYVSQKNNVTGCEGNRALIVVNVGAVPAIANSTGNNPTTCGSSTGSINLTGLSPSTTYSVRYTKNGGAPTILNLTSNASGIVVINGLSAGTYTDISVTLGLCASNVTGPVILTDPNPPATPTVTSNGPKCTGETLNLSTGAVAGATYAWTGPNGFTSTAQNPTINNVTIAATGTYSLTVTVNNCRSAASTVDVVINPRPSAPSVNGNINICDNGTINLTASTNFAGQVTYAWTGPNSFTSAQQNPVITNATSANSGVYNVTVTSAVGNCQSPSASTNVLVSPVPAIANTSGNNPTACGSSTGSINLTGLTPSTTFSVRYTKNGGAPTILNLTSNASGIVAINGLSAGTYTDISVTLGICSSNVTGPVILTDPNPPATPTVTSNGPKCTGETLNLSTGAVAGATYAWTGPNGFTSTVQNPTINNVTVAANGTYSLTVTVNNCRSAASTVDVIINPRPSAPSVNGNINICDNGTINLTASTNFAGQVTYAWTGPNSFTSAQQNPVITNATSANSGVYTVTVTSEVGNCQSPSASTNVLVSPVPSITNSIGNNPTACGSSTGSINLTGLTPSTTYSVRYTKNGGAPTILNLTSNASGIVTINGLSAGTYTDISVNLGICSSNVTGPVTLTDPSPPAAPTPTNNGPKCTGETLNLFTPTVAGATYAWTGPNGFTSAAQNPTINNVTVAANGTYSLTVTVNNCRSTAGTVDVVIHPRPSAPLVTSNINVCNNGTLNLTASTNFAGLVTYAWTGPNGYTSAQQNPVISNVTPANAGVYNVTITSVAGSCQSPSASTTVTVLPVPVITSSSHVNPVGCGSSSGIILLNGLLPSTSYTVSYNKNGVPANVLLTSNAAGTIFVNNLSAGQYTNVTVSLNGCVSNSAGPFSLIDTPPFSVITNSNGPLCEGGTLLLSANATSAGSATYAWTGPNGFASTLQNPSINNAGLINSGVYRVTITINSCSATDSITVTISKTTVGGKIGPDTSVCRGKNNGTLYLTGQLGLVTHWESSINNGVSWNIINNTASFFNFKDLSASTLFRARVQNGACAAVYSTTARVTVRNTIDTVSLQPAYINTCNHDTLITFTANAVYTGTDPISYKWFIDGQLSSTANPFVRRFNPALNHQSPLEYNVYVLAENSFGCGDTSVAGKVVIQPLPVPGIQVSPAKIQLQPNYTFTFRDTSFAGATKLYTWNMGDKLSQTRFGREVTFSYSDTGVYKVRLFVIDRITNCTAEDSVTVQVLAVKGTLYVPNAFYPNSTVNELKTFKLKGTGLAEYHLQIFDSWGKLVFETTELTPDGSPKVAWDGTYMNSGKTLPHDAYVWKVVKAKFRNGKEWDGMSYNGGQPKRFGNVTLFR